MISFEHCLSLNGKKQESYVLLAIVDLHLPNTMTKAQTNESAEGG